MSAEADPRLVVLERRVAQLEADLAEMRDRQSTASTEPTWTTPRAPQSSSSRAWPAPQVTTPADPDAANQHRSVAAGLPVHIDSESVLKWGGVGLVVLAVGFAVSTAISRGWVGAELQLAGAIALSAGLIWVGLRVHATRPGWTHALCSAGIASAFTTVASNLFLDNVSDLVAFISTVVIAAIGVLLARNVRSEWIAATTTAGGLIGWLVIGRSDMPIASTAAWAAVLVAATVGLAIEQRWHAVRLLAELAGMLVLLGLASEANQSGERFAVVAVAVVLAACLMRVPSIGDLSGTWQQLEVQLAIATAPFGVAILVLAFDLDGDTPIASAAFGAAAVVAAVALLAKGRLHLAHFVSLLIGASVAFSIGLAVLLATEATFVALAVQGAGLVLLAQVLDERLRVFANAAVLEVIAVVFAFGAMVDAWDVDASVGDDVAHLLIIVAMVAAGWLTRDRTVRTLAAAVGLGMVLIWLGSVLVHLPQGQAATSVSWTLVGTAVLVGGALRKMREVATTGLGVLGLTVGKLLTVDLREVDTLWRAALFLAIGLGFLRLGFLLPRLMGSRDPDDEEQVGDA
jgi:uncharacterized membrane protein